MYKLLNTEISVVIYFDNASYKVYILLNTETSVVIHFAVNIDAIRIADFVCSPNRECISLNMQSNSGYHIARLQYSLEVSAGTLFLLH